MAWNFKNTWAENIWALPEEQSKVLENEWGDVNITNNKVKVSVEGITFIPPTGVRITFNVRNAEKTDIQFIQLVMAVFYSGEKIPIPPIAEDYIEDGNNYKAFVDNGSGNPKPHEAIQGSPYYYNENDIVKRISNVSKNEFNITFSDRPGGNIVDICQEVYFHTIIVHKEAEKDVLLAGVMWGFKRSKENNNPEFFQETSNTLVSPKHNKDRIKKILSMHYASYKYDT